MNANYSVRNGEVYSTHIFAGNTRLATKMVKRKGTAAPQELGVYYYHGDHLGSSNAITNRSGKFHEHVEYFPYGEMWVEERVAGGENLPHKFTGKELDPETGLYYYGHRYLDPKLSDWISADPPLAKGDYLPVPAISDEAKEHNSKLPGMGGVFNSINLDAYQYAGRNPVKLIDPDGEKVITFAVQVEYTPGVGGTYFKGFAIQYGDGVDFKIYDMQGWQMTAGIKLDGGAALNYYNVKTVDDLRNSDFVVGSIDIPGSTIGVGVGMSGDGKNNFSLNVSKTKGSGVKLTFMSVDNRV